MIQTVAPDMISMKQKEKSDAVGTKVEDGSKERHINRAWKQNCPHAVITMGQGLMESVMNSGKRSREMFNIESEFIQQWA